MIIISGILLVVLMGYAVYGWFINHDIVKGINQKLHSLYLLYPVAHEVLRILKKVQLVHMDSGIKHAIERLEVGENTDKAYENYWYKKVSMVYLIFVLSLIIIIFADVGKEANQLLQGYGILRPEKWEEADTVYLDADLEDMTGKAEREHYQTSIEMEVGPQEYKENEIVPALEKGLDELLKILIGNNESYDEINGKLHMISQIPNTPIQVKYQPEDTNLVGSEGDIYNEDISQRAVTTAVMITLSLQGKKLTHRQELQIEPKQYTKEEQLQRSLDGAVRDANNVNKQDGVMHLPESVEGYRIRWNEEKDDPSLTILVMSMIAMALVWIYSDQEVDKQMKKRKHQMMLEYPEIIHKLTLLLNSGMTIRQGWCKMVEDYTDQRVNQGHNRSYALEEMKITFHELELGIPEEVAYNQFGKRIGILPYLKLSTLIIQNFKKGNKGLIDTLIYEATEAMEDRKAIAKRLGEEAATKLLMPMMTMLVLIFIIVMVPAFISMGI